MLVIATMMSASLIACGGGGDDDDDGGNQTVDPTGTNSQYVMSEILLPTTAAQANQYGLNLDGDEQGRPDNALGQILSTLANQSGDVDLQGAIDEQVADGSIIILANIKATALTMASGVGVWIFLGANPSPAACTDVNDMTCGKHLTGSASFDLDAASPTDALLVGQIVGGKLNAGPGNVTIQISLVEGGDSLTLNLIGARLEIGSVSATGLMSGKLGGAVTDADLQNNILPALNDILADTINEDCTGTATSTDACGCAEGATGRTLLDLFDEDDTCDVTLQELKDNSLISSLLAPDVDLLDGSGNFNPRSDGVKDSLSLGLAFTGVGATFTNPAGVDTAGQ
jgi:hypothetical protein